MLVKARTKERYWGQHRTVSTGEKEDFKDVRHEGCSSMNNALNRSKGNTSGLYLLRRTL